VTLQQEAASEGVKQPALEQGSSRGKRISREAAGTEDVRERFADAYDSYVRALQEGWRPEETQKRLEAAYLDYVRAMLEAQAPQDSVKRFEAYLEYARALQDAWLPQEVRQRLEEGYLNYVRALQAAWAQVDANVLDATTLAAIAQSTLAAACYASSSLPR
jgi:hypothetical protein